VPCNRGNQPCGAGARREVQYSVSGVIRSVGTVVKAFGAGLALLASCSPASPLPPPIPDCQANDAGCTTQTGVGGGGVSDDSGSAASCGQLDLSGSSQCTQCAELQCCPALTTCFDNTDCATLYTCEEACGGLASCVNSECALGAVAMFNEVEICLRGKCPVCNESGVGDPCGGSAPDCAAGYTCFDGWCTADCTASTASTACSGLGPNGTNALGFANACLALAGEGDVCAPGCGSDSDCANFVDTLCLPTTAVGGATVQVCARIADAGH
jgi:hypothetical protein